MKAELISIGTEILLGDILNTNAQYLGKKMMELGINVFRQTTVGDNPDRLKKALEYALEKADLVITTGGLGPTNDDLSKEVAVSVLGQKSVLHQPSYQALIKYFGDEDAIDSNIKQCMFPESAHVLANDVGTAPGCILYTQDKNKRIILLPGPPSEMKHMFDKYVYPILEQESDGVLVSKNVLTTGLGEWKMYQMVKDLIEEQTNPTIAPYAKESYAYLRVTAKAETREDAIALNDITIDKILSRLGDHVYGFDDDKIETDIVRRLIKGNKTLTIAESLTGGMLTSKIVDNPGASKSLLASYIVYTDQAKEEILGVDENLIGEKTAVSQEVCLEMLKGLEKKKPSDFQLATTGYAGPDGEDVGLVYIGLGYMGSYKIKRYHFSGQRNEIRNRSCRRALDLLREKLLEIDK